MTGGGSLAGPPGGFQPSSGEPPGITGVPLLVRCAGEGVSGRLLTDFRLASEESRRDGLARLNAWARGTGVAAAVVENDAGQLFADARALGFDDAGPLPRYAAPARPGLLRRTLSAVLLPRPRELAKVRAIPEALPEAEERALRQRLAPEFDAVPELPGRLPMAGVHLVRDDQAVASGRWRARSEGGDRAPGELSVLHWIAPPDEPDLCALLAREVLLAAAREGALSASFETTHRSLARGLLLARFLPRRSRARILVRQGGDRDLSAPSTAEWHLTTPTAQAPGSTSGAV